jgi:hypothetical protein
MKPIARRFLSPFDTGDAALPEPAAPDGGDDDDKAVQDTATLRCLIERLYFRLGATAAVVISEKSLFQSCDKIVESKAIPLKLV